MLFVKDIRLGGWDKERAKVAEEAAAGLGRLCEEWNVGERKEIVR